MKYAINTCLMVCIIIFAALLGCKKGNTRTEYNDDGSIKSEYIISGGRETIKRYGKSWHPWQIRIHENGKIISDKYYYDSGDIATDYPYIDGMINGTVKDFYKNGELLAVREYRRGKIDGMEVFYYHTGEVLSVANYKYIEPYPDGMLYGNMDVYDKDGTIITSGIYKLGLPWEGTFISANNNELSSGREEKYIHQYNKGKSINVSELSVAVIKPWETEAKAHPGKSQVTE